MFTVCCLKTAFQLHNTKAGEPIDLLCVFSTLLAPSHPFPSPIYSRKGCLRVGPEEGPVPNDQYRVPVAQDQLKIQRVFLLKKY